MHTPGAATPLEGRILLATERSDDPAVYNTTFPLSEILDLHVLVAWKGATSQRTTDVRFYSPDGNRFGEMHAPHSSADMQPMPGQSGVWVRFPVGGTAITAHGLSGRWRVEAALDDGISTVSQTFLLAD